MFGEDLLEAMISDGIPLNNIAIVLSNDHIFDLDCPAIEPNPNFPSLFDLIVYESSHINVDESSNSMSWYPL